MKKLFLIITLLMTTLIITSCNNNNTPAQAEGIVITSAENVRTIKEGDTLQLTATVYPVTIDQVVVWSTSNESIATVSSTGLVTAVAKGNVDIIATSTVTPEVSQKFALVVEQGEVKEVAPESIEIVASTTTCKVGEKITLSARVKPEEANQSVTWTSADTTIATVSRGEVTALKEGSVVITVAAKNNPEITNTITLTFEPSDDPIVNLNWAEMPYSTHEEYMSSDNEAPLKVKGVVTYVTPVNETVVSYFIQNGVDGYYVYAQNNISFPVELGKSYEVGGYKKYYRGLNEIVDVEYFAELTEACTYTENKVDELDPTDLEAMKPYHSSVVYGQATLTNNSTNTKAYSFYADVNGKSTTFRVDPAYMTAEEFAAINEKISTAVVGIPFSFKGLMTAFGYGAASPQILVVKASDIVFAEITDEMLLDAAADALKISSSIAHNVNEITLPLSIEGFDGVELVWSTTSELIDVTTGAVTHTTKDETVVLKATLSLNGKLKEVEFTVSIFGVSEKEYETLVSMDLEDCAETDKYGNSVVKSSYKAAVVSLGTPVKQWLLSNALIAGAANDVKDGLMSIRVKADGRVEIQEDGEYNVVEFAAATYGNDAHGVQITVEYSTDSGETWTANETVITVDHKELQTYRITLPEGVKRVAIVITKNTGNRVNLDNIKLMK